MIAVQAAIDGGDQHGAVDALDHQRIEIADCAGGLAHLGGRHFRYEADADFAEDFQGVHFFGREVLVADCIRH